MIRLLADENFNNHILRGIRRRLPSADIVRVQDVEVAGADDSDVLEWAAQNRRILLTHDVNTMSAPVYARVLEGKPMPGVFEVSQQLPLRVAIEEIILLIECSQEGEWEGQVRYLPLR